MVIAKVALNAAQPVTNYFARSAYLMKSARHVSKIAKTKNQKVTPPAPVLRFTPLAWAKLVFLRDCGRSEIGGFGIASLDNPMLVQDLQLVRQRCTFATVEFDDESVADFFDEQVDQGRTPAEFGRLWVHTHPGDSPLPSGTDEDTLDRCFAGVDWSLMFILAKGGESYARLRFNVGPGGEMEIPVEVAYDQAFSGTSHGNWQQEYDDNVTIIPTGVAAITNEPAESLFGNEWEPEEIDPWDEWLDYEARLAMDGEEL